MNDHYQTKASILCIGTPKGLEFGIDLMQWECGEKYHGINRIPSGVHLIYYGFPRRCWWLLLAPGQVLVTRWDAISEDFSRNFQDEEELDLITSVKHYEFENVMARYADDCFEKWSSLTCFISVKLWRDLTPQQCISSLYDEPLPDEKLLPTNPAILQEAPFHKPRYLSIPLHPPHSFSPEQITRFYLDKSDILKDLLRQREELLGEYQFAFLSFLLGHSYDSLLQWKSLTITFCSCEQLIEESPDIFSSFIMDTLCPQLDVLPEDFFEDPLSSDNFLSPTLSGFFDILEDTHPLDEGIKEGADKLRTCLWKRFKVDVREHSGREGLPIIVE